VGHPAVRIVIIALVVIAIVLAALLGYTGEDEYGLPVRVPGRPATTTPATAPATTGDAGARLDRAGGSWRMPAPASAREPV
jgi:hypothetical protein